MKKIILIVSTLCIVSFFPGYLSSTEASEKSQQELPNFTTSNKEKNQLYGYFMLELYHKEIMSAIQEYYADNKIKGYATPTEQDIDMVSISFKGNKEYKGLEKFSYVLKISLIPLYSSKGKPLGTDTLYFAVEPIHQTIELVKYEHIKPPKNTK